MMKLERQYRMIQMRGRGATYAQISEAVGQSVLTVGKFFRQGAKAEGPPPAWVLLDARFLAATGHDVSTICAKTGLSVDAAKECMAGVKVVSQPPAPPAPKPKKQKRIPLRQTDIPSQIMDLLAQGYSRRTVAEKLGISAATVQIFGKGVKPPNDPTWRRIVEMMVMGYSWEYVANMYKVPLELIEKRVAGKLGPK